MTLFPKRVCIHWIKVKLRQFTNRIKPDMETSKKLVRVYKSCPLSRQILNASPRRQAVVRRSNANNSYWFKLQGVNRFASILVLKRVCTTAGWVCLRFNVFARLSQFVHKTTGHRYIVEVLASLANLRVDAAAATCWLNWLHFSFDD